RTTLKAALACNVHFYINLFNMSIRNKLIRGESGSHSRPMHAEWARKLQDDSAAAGVPFFMKQLGAAFVGPDDGFGLFGAAAPYTSAKTYAFKRLKDRAGANMVEWPEDLRVREWPKEAESWKTL
ncbi:DUF5131 family protein, partial [Acidithiobacillus ferriphilus]